ncbi:apolipophorin-3-like isoform X2 [Neocloeon triangulifer]|uniref:apolipophorin-3-like isoform X2 n=1 Tax=Neocloeon triangulifer TaxID=2078957 RepID=UPI00286F31BA|nr:apolipophorin-3-like isoform X2 [Neocloeon triangulifer]
MRTVVVLAALIALSQASVVRRETKEFPSLEELVKSAQENVKTFTDQVASLFTPGEEQKQTLAKVGETLSNQTALFTQNLQTLVDNLSNAAKDNQGLQEAASRLNTTLRGLVGEQNAQEAEQATAELSTKVQSAVSTVVEEASKIAKNVDTETAPIRAEVQQATKQAVDQAVELAKYLQQQFQAAISGSTPAPTS